MSKRLNSDTETTETILAPGELRDYEDNFICSFREGSLDYFDDSDVEGGWLDLIKTEGVDLLDLEIGELYKIVINGILIIIHLTGVNDDNEKGVITAYYASTGLDINLSKYQESHETSDEIEGKIEDDEIYIDPNDPDSISVTFQNIGITDDTEMEPCSYTEIDGAELWFANPKELSDSLEYCEHHTRELLDDEKAVSLNYLDEDRCQVLCELMTELEDNEDGFAEIIMSPKETE